MRHPQPPIGRENRTTDKYNNKFRHHAYLPIVEFGRENKPMEKSSLLSYDWKFSIISINQQYSNNIFLNGINKLLSDLNEEE
jgi:hypothetical protein